MSERQGIFDTIAESLAPVHRDGHKFLFIGAGLALLFFLIWPPLAWILVVVTLWIAYFFRDPDRVTPLREGLVIAPADGCISSVETVLPPPELGLGAEERVRISTFLSVLDVHICRAPVAGRIVRSVYVPGAFFNAALDKASEENERRGFVIQKSDGGELA
ncbi:MAG: phosphatidylserine decarboxylase, partial [Hyphomicrobium sp.]